MPDPIAASNIAAQAFRFCELGPISSFSDDSDQAEDAREHYQAAVDTILELCDWSFASTLATLPPADAPESGFVADPDLPGLFRLPPENVKLREVMPRSVNYRLDQTFLRADQTTALTIRYTRRVTNEALLPKSFQTAAAYRLAVLLAPRWVSDRTKRADLKADAREMLKEAEKVDGRTASPRPYDAAAPEYGPVSDWVTEATR